MDALVSDINEKQKIIDALQSQINEITARRDGVQGEIDDLQAKLDAGHQIGAKTTGEIETENSSTG